MKIVFFPGVGFNKDLSKYEGFLKTLQKRVSFEYEIFNWLHSHLENEHFKEHLDLDKNLRFRKIRGLFSEVVLDFQHVLFHAQDMKIPEADLYMGHSAGGIIALAKSQNSNCVVFGSPIKLVQTENYQKESIIRNCKCKSTKVLNFVHKNDIIGYSIEKENTENHILSSPFYSLATYSPIAAHRYYWKSNVVIDKTTDKLVEWGF